MQAVLFDELNPTGPDAYPHPDAIRTLAQSLPSSLYLGTSSWAFPGWADLVYAHTYDERTLSRQGLSAYSKHPLFRCVSIDRTFYAPISAQTFRSYAEQVPDTFRFAVKVPASLLSQSLPHTHAPNPDFLNPDQAESIFFEPLHQGLGNKLGWVLLQCPPQPDSITRSPSIFYDGLCQLLERAKRYQLPTMVEIRDRALLTPELVKRLISLDTRLCLSLHPRLPGLPAQFRIQAAFPPGPLFIRWNLNRQLSYNSALERYAPFHTRQDPDEEAHQYLAQHIHAWLNNTKQPVWVLANNKAEGCAPLTLLKLAHKLASFSSPYLNK